MSMNLVKIADSTLNACENGFYSGPKDVVHFIDSLDAAIIGTEFISAEDDFDFDPDEPCTTVTEITDETTAIAGKRLAESGKDIAILNFASARNPGGGFLHGAKAQEEDLCRVSALYACLTRDDLPYYKINKECKSALYTDAIIYSPKVPFLRDENYQWLEEPFELSVVTCPAPNLNRSFGKSGALGPTSIADGETVSTEEIVEIFQRRVARVLSAMVIFGHKNIVLGAWGCGAFGNNPKIVAKVFKEVLETEKFKKCFDLVVFAIPNQDSVNYRAFVEVFENVE